MPRPSIEQLRNLGDIATVYQWNLNFITFPTAVASPSANDLNLRCLSSAIPTKGEEKQELSLRGHKIYQAGQAQYGNELTLTFVETVDNKIAKFLSAWHEACVATNSGTHVKQSDVECDIQIERLNRQDVGNWSYTLIGCFLSTYTHADLSDANEQVKPTLTLSFDYFKEAALG